MRTIEIKIRACITDDTDLNALQTRVSVHMNKLVAAQRCDEGITQLKSISIDRVFQTMRSEPCVLCNRSQLEGRSECFNCGQEV